MSKRNMALKLRARLEKGGILLAPGCYDVLSARLVEKVGFEAAFMTGYGASASILGMPDYGMMTMNEMATVCANMVSVLDIPLLADVDTGYGNPLNVYRTIREFERAGVAAVHLEDQVFPKRCGHMEKKAVIPVSEYLEKLRAALDAREDMLIIARTDSRATHGIDEAIHRCQQYHAAGADLIYIDAPHSVEELRRISTEIEGWKFVNMVEFGKTPLLTDKELEELGFNIVIAPTTTAFAAARAIENVLIELRDKRTTREYLENLTTFSEFTKIVGIDELVAMEQKYKVDEFKSGQAK